MIMSANRQLTAREKSEIHHFDEMAQKYDTNYTYNTPFTQYKIQKKLKIMFKDYDKNAKLNILEIGAGTGEYTQYLAGLFPNAKITATDISPKILDVAKVKCKDFKNVSFKVASAYELPFKEETFDMVCGFYILHHIDTEPTLKEMHRVLKSGGTALFYEPNILNPMVLAVKSIPFIKKRVGDSPEEWAMNPAKLMFNFNPFRKFKWKTSEFILIPSFIPLKLAVSIDKVTTAIGNLPAINYHGGSVFLNFIK